MSARKLASLAMMLLAVSVGPIAAIRADDDEPPSGEHGEEDEGDPNGPCSTFVDFIHIVEEPLQHPTAHTSAGVSVDLDYWTQIPGGGGRFHTADDDVYQRLVANWPTYHTGGCTEE